MIYPTTVLLAMLTDNPAFHASTQAFLQKWLCSSGDTISYTPLGRAYNRFDPSLGQTMNAALVSVIYGQAIQAPADKPKPFQARAPRPVSAPLRVTCFRWVCDEASRDAALTVAVPWMMRPIIVRWHCSNLRVAERQLPTCCAGDQVQRCHALAEVHLLDAQADALHAGRPRLQLRGGLQPEVPAAPGRPRRVLPAGPGQLHAGHRAVQPAAQPAHPQRRARPGGQKL